MIEIDGSVGEGGGQIIRTALALSTITGKSFTAKNIRQNRDKPGLKNQHLTGITALEELSGAKASNVDLGSDFFEFVPGKINPGTIIIDIKTAGSITLLMQCLLLPCCLANGKTRLKIKGGTDTKWSPTIDYFLNLILPNFEKLADFKIHEIKRGYYPKGQGLFDITIKPKTNPDLTSIDLTKIPKITKIKGISSASVELRQADVAGRQAKGAKKKLSSLDIPVKIVEEYTKTESIGTVITLWMDQLGADFLGERKKRAEGVGVEAGAKLLLLLCSDAIVDSHLADNLIPLLGLYGGKIKTDKITNHIKSNIYVCEKFLDVKFEIDEENNTIISKVYK
jgi:RNA 3'-phosphate cyclase